MIHAGMDRPDRKKSMLVRTCRLAVNPMPITTAKYTMIIK